ncbi:interleukin-17A-like [Toxotes jaculatrix]|uniref:interleukin-17A-like n=1 Tax=Toxotes jaculatrix TaxID=941984 RepID=UPI001B3B0D36|nr:interleukin-17A-like [Toxotes jaculatrix]
MTRAALQMVCLCSLLIFSSHTTGLTAAAAQGSRCISLDELNNRTDRFWKTHSNKLSFPQNLLQDARTCAQTAKQMRGDVSSRSLAPWRYSLNQDVDRFPREIAFAECVCQGCIINQHEDLSYNSVPVLAQLMVLKKTRCPRDPNKYVIKKDFIKVPVACTCAVPRLISSESASCPCTSIPRPVSEPQNC